MRNIMVLVYINNISIAARPGTNDIAWFKREFSAQFKIKDLGPINQILRANVIRDREAGTLRLN